MRLMIDSAARLVLRDRRGVVGGGAAGGGGGGKKSKESKEQRTTLRLEERVDPLSTPVSLHKGSSCTSSIPNTPGDHKKRRRRPKSSCNNNINRPLATTTKHLTSHTPKPILHNPHAFIQHTNDIQHHYPWMISKTDRWKHRRGLRCRKAWTLMSQTRTTETVDPFEQAKSKFRGKRQ